MLKISSESPILIDDEQLVKLKTMNDIFEICYIDKRNTNIYIKKIDSNYYEYLPTGEVRECSHIESRADNKAQVSQSLKRLRDYINANISDVNNCKWITLTYKENMTDTNRLYNDFKKFIQKFRRKYGKFEYIVAMEPQNRGAWHCHCIIIFDKKAPFIRNKIIEQLWCQGFTKTNKLNDIDNIGAYLTAYLGDMALDECIENNISYNENDIKIVDEIGNKKLSSPKKFIKGARLSMYPPKFNLYRVSRGILKPKEEYLSYHVAKEKIGCSEPTFKKTIKLIDKDNKFENLIAYEYYNKKRN